VPASVNAFSEDFVHAKESQWRAFRRRSGIEHAPVEFVAVVRSVEIFLMPIATALSMAEGVPKNWTPPGPWR